MTKRAAILISSALTLLILTTDVFAQESVWQSYYTRGREAFAQGRYAEAENLFRAAIAEANRIKDSSVNAPNMMLDSLTALSNALNQQKKYAEAERVSKETLQLLTLLKQTETPEYGIALNNLGLVLTY